MSERQLQAGLPGGEVNAKGKGFKATKVAGKFRSGRRGYRRALPLPETR